MSLAVRRGLDPLFPAPSPLSCVDRSFAVRRLTRNAVSLIAANPHTDYLGTDAAVSELASGRGFRSIDLAILRIAIGAVRHTLICVPERIWYARKHDLVMLKRLAAQQNVSCFLIPEAAIQRQPRLSTARMIEDALGVRVTPDICMALIVHLMENGSSSTILEAAAAISHPAPISAILHLAALGVVRIDGRRAISPETQIHLPDKTGGVGWP